MTVFRATQSYPSRQVGNHQERKARREERRGSEHPEIEMSTKIPLLETCTSLGAIRKLFDCYLQREIIKYCACVCESVRGKAWFR